jgi:parallel beta-helix repeat protein
MLYEGGAGLIEENDIVLIGRAGIQISTGANPTVRKNRIHDGKMGGVVVYDSGLGVIEENEILSNPYSGVQVSTGGNPMVRGNRIQGNFTGVLVWNGGQGTFENNVFAENKRGAWDIAKDCDANVKRSGNAES